MFNIKSRNFVEAISVVSLPPPHVLAYFHCVSFTKQMFQDIIRHIALNVHHIQCVANREFLHWSSTYVNTIYKK
jgi:hypothetical protein